MNPGLYGAWKDAVHSLDGPRFLRDLARHGRIANERSGLVFVAMAVKAITAGAYAPNSELTIALKGTSKPLVGGSEGGDLQRSIMHVVAPDGLTLWVGVNRQAKSKDGIAMENIARYVHDGFSIDLKANPKVRIAVMARLREVAGGKGRGASKAKELIAAMRKNPGHKDIWIVPARPFLGDVVDSDAFGVVYVNNAEEAVTKALEGAA